MRIWKTVISVVAIASWSLPATAAAVQADDLFADNLGIHYDKVPYQDGTFGARLTRPPEPNSPAAQIGLETGDIVFMLDNMRFREPADVLNHVDRTTVTLIDVRTNGVTQSVVILPGPVITVNPTVDIQPQPRESSGKPGWITQPDLRRVVSEELRDRHVKYTRASLEINGRFLDWNLGWPEFNFFNASPAVYAQFQVEIIRLSLERQQQRDFWEPYLQRVEARIAELLSQGPAIGAELRPVPDDDGPDAKAAPAEKDDEPVMFGGEDEKVQEILEEAIAAKARQARLTPRHKQPPAKGGIHKVTLVTPNGQGRVYIMPRTPYRIRAFGRVPLSKFQAYSAGDVTGLMSGEYAYIVRYSDGAPELDAHTPLATFKVDEGGNVPVR